MNNNIGMNNTNNSFERLPLIKSFIKVLICEKSN